MTNKPSSKPEPTGESLPAMIPGFTLLVPEQAIKEAEEERRAGFRFPDAAGGNGMKVYGKSLVDVPFVIVSEARWSRTQAHAVPVYDDNGLQAGVKQFPAQQCVQFVIRCLIYDTEMERWEYAEPQLAEFTWVYLLNQVRGWVQDSERFSWLYNGRTKTVRRNPKFTTTGGEHPYMLDDYDRELDPAFNTTEVPF